MKRVILITGPPCSGKTTYVRDNAAPGDLILDQDDIGPAAMKNGLAQVTAMQDGTAWVIRCAPGPQQRETLAARIGATTVMHLEPPEHVLLTRARARPQPARHVQAIRKYYEYETGPRTAAGTPCDPQPRPRTRW